MRKFLAAILFTCLAASAQAQIAYNVIYPTGVDQAAALNTALANSAVTPVQLALDPANPTRQFVVSVPLVIPGHGLLKCENQADNGSGSGSGQIVIGVTTTPTFVGSAVVKLTGTDPKVVGCAASSYGGPANVDGFAVDGSLFPILDTIHASYNTGMGLNLTGSNGVLLHPQLLGHSTFYNNQWNAIAVEWSSSGSVSDLDLGGADVGTNCTGGCSGQGDVYIYGSNGKVHDFRIEWSWNEGFTCDNCQLDVNNSLFDRTGGPALHTHGASLLHVGGGVMEGWQRANSYAGPAIIFDTDQNNGRGQAWIDGVLLSQWSAAASDFKVASTYQGPALIGGRVVVDGAYVNNGTNYGIYADQLSHDAIKSYEVAPQGVISAGYP